MGEVWARHTPEMETYLILTVIYTINTAEHDAQIIMWTLSPAVQVGEWVLPLEIISVNNNVKLSK